MARVLVLLLIVVPTVSTLAHEYRQGRTRPGDPWRWLRAALIGLASVWALQWVLR